MCAWHGPHSEQWRESCTNEIFTWFKLCRRLPCLTCLYSQQDQLWTFNPLFSVVSSQMWLLLLFLWLQDRKVIWIPTLKNCPSFNATFASRRVLPYKHVGQRHHHVCLACADWGDAVKNWCEDKTSLKAGYVLAWEVQWHLDISAVCVSGNWQDELSFSRKKTTDCLKLAKYNWQIWLSTNT